MSNVDMPFKKYRFRRYRDEYPRLFCKERNKLRKFLGKKAVIEHVGSTAITGLGGKGIIDIAIKTPKNLLNKYKRSLKSLGYESSLSHPEDNRRIFFQKKIKYNGKERRVHVHIVLTDAFWMTFINFRDKLRKNPKLIEEYSKIKKEAIKYAKGEGKKYRAYKNKFLEKHSR